MTPIRTALTTTLVLALAASPSLAGRGGGGRGGGMRGGGGMGGMRGGMGGMPGGGMRGGGMGGMPGGGMGGMRGGGGMGGMPGGNMGGMRGGFSPGGMPHGGGMSNFGGAGSPGARGGQFGGAGSPGARGGQFGGAGNAGNRGGQFGGDRINSNNPFENRGGNVAGIGNRGDQIGGNRINNNPFENRSGNVGNRASFDNRAAINDGRTNIGGNRINAGDNDRIGNTNIANNRDLTVNNNEFNRGFNNDNFNRGLNGYGYGNGAGWAARNPYAGYHSGWVHGYWNGHAFPAWPGYAAAGLAGWGLGSSLYNWGLASYANPYYAAVPQQVAVATQPVVYDYSQPIDTSAAPPDQETTAPAMDGFEQARQAFAAGDYAGALQLVEAALGKVPNDATLHEFRALCLFALGRYNDAAAALYAVLSVGPGWDWTTLISLYPDPDAYTAQLRKLEAVRKAHPDDAAPSFVLAYHYLAAGHPEASVKALEDVVRLMPNDSLSAQLLKQLSSGPDASATASAPAQPAPTAAPPASTVPPGKLAGKWTAPAAAGGGIALELRNDGTFTWTVDQKGKPAAFQGEYTAGDDLITLAPPGATPMVGRVRWTGPDAFQFQVPGTPPDEPGLTFTRSG